MATSRGGRGGRPPRRDAPDGAGGGDPRAAKVCSASSRVASATPVAARGIRRGSPTRPERADRSPLAPPERLSRGGPDAPGLRALARRRTRGRAGLLRRGRARARSLPTYPTGAFTQAYVASYAAWVEILSARFANGRALHEQATAIADRYGMLFWIAAGPSVTRSARGPGEPPAGARASRLGDGAVARLGAEAFLPFVQTQRAHAPSHFRRPGTPHSRTSTSRWRMPDADRALVHRGDAPAPRRDPPHLDPHGRRRRARRARSRASTRRRTGRAGLRAPCRVDLVELDVRRRSDAERARRRSETYSTRCRQAASSRRRRPRPNLLPLRRGQRERLPGSAARRRRPTTVETTTARNSTPPVNTSLIHLSTPASDRPLIVNARKKIATSVPTR